MTERKQCEFQLIRYVPDPVKNEFVNIGVLVRAEGEQSMLRFTRDWGRVRCLDPDADTQMLEALEIEVGQRLRAQPSNHPEPIVALLESSLSNGIQITERKAYLAESFLAGLEDLMRRYVDTPRRERSQRRSGRSALHAAMRARFEEAGVWTLMRKQIAAAPYTKPGDPLRIDCGYRPNGVVRMFQAISLENDADDAKLLAFSAFGLIAGVKRVDKADLELTAIVEPIRHGDGDEPNEDRIAQYRFGVEIMEEHTIRVLTSSDLPRIAETARRELRV
ncbi:MAG TPA: DUF3037 domain-containing protein [Acidobacteriaceae bacterium]|jgi:hypothetical protein|nr:DUF3037 domain-containing protein [Acidobacteriaceae bacterium]